MDIQFKDKFFDLITNNPTKDGFINLMKNACGEMDNLDFKEQWIDKGKLAKIVLALANSGGGIIVVGVKENDDSIEPIGINNLEDKATIESWLSKFIPRLLDYEVLDFVFDSPAYDGEFKGRKFQILLVYDRPERLPFISLSQGDGIDKDTIYVRRGTRSEKISKDELESIIKNRMLMMVKDGNDLSLNEHLEQLKQLFEYVEPTKRVLVEKGTRGNYFSGAGAALLSLSERMNSAFGTPDRYEDIENPNYPDEDFEAFILRMIEAKKFKIEKALDLK